jgi:cobalt-zinc-cadmium efflux system protein
MGAGHDHGAVTGTAQQSASARRRLWAALAILLLFTVVEAVAAALTGSLALVSDAGHMFTDVLALGMALAAITAARRASAPISGRGRSTAGSATHRPVATPAASPGHSFGLYRLEVLAALANAVLLAGVAGWVGYEAAQRFRDPTAVLTGPMMIVAAAGLAANIAAFALLRSAASGSIAVRGAYLEVLADLAGSVGVLAAGVTIALTGWRWVDPLVAVAVAAFILPRTWRLAADALRVLTQAAPAGLDLAAVRGELAGVPGVRDVHDLHVWTLTSGMEVTSAHLTLDPRTDVGPVLTAARARLQDEFHIEHATLQIEPAEARGACQPVSW